jgi:hypothetical protein
MLRYHWLQGLRSRGHYQKNDDWSQKALVDWILLVARTRQSTQGKTRINRKAAIRGGTNLLGCASKKGSMNNGVGHDRK